MRKTAFTLIEVLIAILIVGVVAGLVVPAIISKLHNTVLNLAYNREIQAITDAVDSLETVENKSFFNSPMYLTEEPEDSYDNSSGMFLKRYFKIAKYCGDEPKGCFGNKYFEYKNRTSEDYELEIKGSCALLKNGMSLCISPQIGENAISGYIDLNGPKAPNVLGRDLKTFTLPLKTKTTVVQVDKKVFNYCKDNPEAEDCDTCIIDTNVGGHKIIKQASIPPGMDCYEYLGDPKYPELTACPQNSRPDHWVGALVACREMGGHLPTMSELADIAKSIYPNATPQISAYEHLSSSSTPDICVAKSLGFDVSNEFNYLWSSEEYVNASADCVGNQCYSTARFRYFASGYTGVVSENRASANMFFICLQD